MCLFTGTVPELACDICRTRYHTPPSATCAGLHAPSDQNRALRKRPQFMQATVQGLHTPSSHVEQLVDRAAFDPPPAHNFVHVAVAFLRMSTLRGMFLWHLR
jgi:hypothetical protein